MSPSSDNVLAFTPRLSRAPAMPVHDPSTTGGGARRHRASRRHLRRTRRMTALLLAGLAGATLVVLYLGFKLGH